MRTRQETQDGEQKNRRNDQNNRKKRSAGGWKRVAYWVVFFLFCGLFLLSGAKLLDWFLHASGSARDYDELAQLHKAGVQVQMEQTETDAVTGQTGQAAGDAEPEIPGELAALYQENADLIGWITIDGTRIDYPVMHTPQDPEHYLRRDFFGNANDWGVPFLSGACDPSRPSDNLIIYGHHMQDGSMFSALDSYKDPTFLRAHPTIRFATLYGTGTYEIVQVFTLAVYTGEADEFSYDGTIDFADENAFAAYWAQASAHARYNTGKTAQFGDKLLTLSTCEYSQENGRIVIIAKKCS